MRLRTFCERSWPRQATTTIILPSGWRLPCRPPRRLTSTTPRPRVNHDLVALDRKWQPTWPASRAHRSPPAAAAAVDAPTEYVLGMFPYPSGALHMGHVRVYTITDVLARHRRMRGRRVLCPMGWDAFGLPAENAAYERGVAPDAWTRDNIRIMKAQLKAMNTDLDWDREIQTCDPSFYKHTQKLFLLLHEQGLAYQAEASVNFDPVDQTVLANEQVDSNGRSWRSGAQVEQRKLKQWLLRITAFREALLEDLKFLERDSQWPDPVIAMQRHWLGHSRGASVDFSLFDNLGNLSGKVAVYTTRLDTIFAAEYVALSASHPLISRLRLMDPKLNEFVEHIPRLGPDSKKGYRLPGAVAMGPQSTLRGVTGRLIPIYVSPYVLDGYGEGAVMGVPGHDARDLAFWQQNQKGKSYAKVVMPENATIASNDDAFEGHGILSTACGPYSGLPSEEASAQLLTDLQRTSQSARPAEHWRLRDWLISRQRYWGTPIPIIHCPSCGPVAVPDADLPVTLPPLPTRAFQRKAGNPLAEAAAWRQTACPSCGGAAERETDTMDTFLCSSWYMFRFADPRNAAAPFDPAAAAAHLPVDVYVGGVEHAILHLLYARFVAKFLASGGDPTTTPPPPPPLWPAGAAPAVRGEPFRRLVSQGMVHARTYVDPRTGACLAPHEVDCSDPAAPRAAADGRALVARSEKMSKSRRNGVDAAAAVARHGADALRAHLLFAAPVADVLEWDEAKIAGTSRWLRRVLRLVADAAPALLPPAATAPGDPTGGPLEPFAPVQARSLPPGPLAGLWAQLASTAAGVDRALEKTMAFNTCISDLMQLTNALAAPALSAPPTSPALRYCALSALLRLLAPFAPAVAEEGWAVLHGADDAAAGRFRRAPTARRVREREAGARDSVFDHAFPRPEDFFGVPGEGKEGGGPHRQTCAVMENGRKRMVLEIGLPGAAEDGTQLEGAALEEWACREIHNTDMGRAWLEKKRARGRWKRVVVVGGGKTVNFVG